MGLNLLFILWNTNPEIFPDSSIPLRWYGLFFALGFLLGQWIISFIFKKEGKPDKDVDALTYFMVGATVIGARLGHCLFYDPEFYLSNPIEILKIWEGGLASHGATVGILVGMWLYSRKRPDQSWLWILDRIVIVVALGGSLIRMGNLMNSEILGKPTDKPWAVVFANPVYRAIMHAEESRIEQFTISKAGQDTVMNGQLYQPLQFSFVFGRDQMQGSSIEAFVTSTLPNVMEFANRGEALIYYDRYLANAKPGFDEKGKPTLLLTAYGIPRHPAMVYEALSTFFLFGLLFFLWYRADGKIPEGRLFSLFVVLLFTLRFFYEFLKENQVDFESDLPLNMGQILSIPMVVAGLVLLFRTFKTPKTQELD
ncbi:MAG TPA: prolipoprotein diacylglyceryl transferase [Catalimonadaceae bacterium]|jgi:phosphatidylglycerol:prolipoprotein diacylglycerol transferase|nr:prolipoprotein diacylglyceryl transferase [Catalimonadaceae bacterium]